MYVLFPLRLEAFNEVGKFRYYSENIFMFNIKVTANDC